MSSTYYLGRPDTGELFEFNQWHELVVALVGQPRHSGERLYVTCDIMNTVAAIVEKDASELDAYDLGLRIAHFVGTDAVEFFIDDYDDGPYRDPRSDLLRVVDSVDADSDAVRRWRDA